MENRKNDYFSGCQTQDVLVPRNVETSNTKFVTGAERRNWKCLCET